MAGLSHILARITRRGPSCVHCSHRCRCPSPPCRPRPSKTTQYVGGGQALSYRVRWTLKGADAYEAFSEMNIKDKWVTQFKVVLKKQ